MSRVIKRVLIFRLGSLGDTIVALPAFHLIAKAYPSAQRWVLTQTDADPRAASIPQLLAGSELVHDFIRYPLRTRAPSEFLRLRREIRRFRPDVLVYLAEPRGWLKTLRDVLFFRWCGIPRLIGVPYSRRLQRRRQVSTGEFEFEGARLLRCLRGLGDTDIDAPGAFDLGLEEPERVAARAALGPLPPSSPVLMFSVGARVDVKDWGDDNWTTLLQRLGPRLHGWSLVALGAGVEHERSARLLAAWPGPSLNLCGVLSVRESGAVLERGRSSSVTTAAPCTSPRRSEPPASWCLVPVTCPVSGSRVVRDITSSTRRSRVEGAGSTPVLATRRCASPPFAWRTYSARSRAPSAPLLTNRRSPTCMGLPDRSDADRVWNCRHCECGWKAR